MDQEHIRLAQRGDEDALNELIMTYQQPVFSLCYRMLRVHTEAEDAAQEVMVKAVMKLHSYDADRPFKPWILRIASNECIDRIRRHKDAVSLDGMGEGGAWEWHVGNSPNPESALLKQEEQALVNELLKELAPLDRLVVTLFYWDGLAYTDISEVTGLSVSAIKSRLFRARRELASLLVKEGTYA
jgi:RNA polymerase sigma-70 factor (ECF subfamily)